MALTAASRFSTEYDIMARKADVEDIIINAKEYARTHSVVTGNPPQWLYDALYCAYISGAERALGIRIIN